MWDVFFSFFVITALALLFAHAWNLFAETLVGTWEIKDSEGNLKDPILQTLTYAIIMTCISIGILIFVHNYTDIDIAAGKKGVHRKPTDQQPKKDALVDVEITTEFAPTKPQANSVSVPTTPAVSTSISCESVLIISDVYISLFPLIMQSILTSYYLHQSNKLICFGEYSPCSFDLISLQTDILDVFLSLFDSTTHSIY